MQMHLRLGALEKIYALHADFCGPFDLVCGPGCALCCTANVTLTTLEALKILRHWQDQGRAAPLAALAAAAQRPRFQPTLSINRMAALCLQGAPVPDEAADPGVGPCPLLEAQRCSIYSARPLACRAMVSRQTCGRGGTADMPEEILTANHLLMQFIEALDLPGASGNLADVLLFLLRPETLAAYAAGGRVAAPPPLIVHHAIPALMMPPELQARLLPLAQAARQCLRTTEA
jgi:Fe-S-cluster containining protein